MAQIPFYHFHARRVYVLTETTCVRSYVNALGPYSCAFQTRNIAILDWGLGLVALYCVM